MTVATAWDIDEAGQRLPDWARRYLPQGASLVVSEQMRTAALMAEKLVERGGIMVVSGPAGSGKSTVLGAVAAVSAIHVANVELPARTRDKALWLAIADAVIGGGSSGTIPELQNMVRAHVAARPTLLIVDEAQNIGLPAMIVLRWLSGASAYPFGLILAGAGLDSKIDKEPMLATRVSRRILLEPQRFGDFLPQLRQFHPLLQATSEPVLTKIDGTFAKGSWRHWSNVVSAAQEIQVDALDLDAASVAIEMITGRRPW